MRKHFDLAITDYQPGLRAQDRWRSPPKLPPMAYIVRTGLLTDVLDDAATACSYKSLSQVERAFLGCIKTVDLHVRPIYHWLADRVRAHVFLCMLASYLEWHMRKPLAPMLFDDTEKQVRGGARQRGGAGATLRGSDPQADHGLHTGWAAGAQLPHRCWSIWQVTSTRNTIVTAIASALPLTVLARLTPVQRRAYELLKLTV